MDPPEETPSTVPRETTSETLPETAHDAQQEKLQETRHSRSYFTQDCSVCLTDFVPGDTARILCCGHYFHKDCVDAWLTKHSTSCPVCKTDMVAALNLPRRPSPVATAPASPEGSSTNFNAVSPILPSVPSVPSVHRAGQHHRSSYNTYVPMSMMAA
ncbi:hypothetical protein IW150_005715 [Coemansia sp. RSA 2607]|nr:hypothetical protein IW150_005715 [Coemansia sp. RSA 2607]